MLSCSYTHIQVKWTFSFWKKIFYYSVANHLYYMQQILHNKYFCLTVWLENMLLHRLSFLYDLAWKHYSIYIISQTKCTTNIFVWRSGLKTWFHKDCHNRKYFLFHCPAWKCFVVLIISRKCTANIFVSQSGLKTLLHGHHWLQQYLLVVQVSYTWVKIFFFMTGLEKFLQFILSGKPVWRSGLTTRFCGDYRSQQLFT